MLHVFIMQGAPGSGKSTIAREIARGCHAVIHSTDGYHHDDDGIYRFKPDKAPEFHKRNQQETEVSLRCGCSVVVDNTNIKAWEARPYVEMARRFNASVVFVRCTGQWLSIHSVPQERVDMMRATMEDLTVEKCLAARYPWESPPSK